MIFILISLATILTFVSWMYPKKASLRYTLGFASLLFLAGSVYLLTDHFVHHTGMKTETVVEKKEIYSAGDTKLPFGVLVYKTIGDKSEHQVLVYRDKTSDKDATAHFIPNKKKINQAIKKSAHYKTSDGDKAYVSTTTKRYTWKSDFDKLMFGFGGEDGELISQKSVVSVPKDTWLTLTPEEADKLEKLAPKLKAEQEQELKTNPQMAMKLQAMAKVDPKAVTKMQVDAIKKALNIN